MPSRAALGGSVAANVGLATHYHADYVLPYWSASLSPAGQIGRHLFYRWRGGVGETRAFSAQYAGREPLIAAWTRRAAPPASGASGAAEPAGRVTGVLAAFNPAPGETELASAREAPPPAAAPTPFRARPLMLASKTADPAP